MKVAIILYIISTLCSLVAIYLSFWVIPRMKKIFKEKEKQIRQDAIKGSKATIEGQNSEKILPLFQDFPYNIQDLRFFGSPIDYIVFDGLQEKIFGNKNKDIDIVIAEVKSGNQARLSFGQKAIREAARAKRVRFEEWYVKDGKLEIK